VNSENLLGSSVTSVPLGDAYMPRIHQFWLRVFWASLFSGGNDKLLGYQGRDKLDGDRGTDEFA
jgi:hypothetical protein